MKDIKNMVDTVNQQIANNGSNLPATEKTARQSGDFIGGLFRTLKLTFPAWRQNFKTEKEFIATKQLWLQTLIDEGITSPEEINRGLKAARNHESPFFPSIGQFMKWTKEPVKEYRVNEEAYKVHVPRIMPHTTEEYKEMGERGLEKLKKLRGKS